MRLKELANNLRYIPPIYFLLNLYLANRPYQAFTPPVKMNDLHKLRLSRLA